MQQYTDRNLSYKFIKHRLSFTLKAQKKMKVISELHIYKTKKYLLSRHSLLTFGATKTLEFYHVFTMVQKEMLLQKEMMFHFNDAITQRPD
jgi:hypothetical protein